ncbi:HalOD1 output domain-containing protein [Halobacterium sp. R2-5]|uniref:HalOD1 output domain-containing protein n=1 Tax=Halobacterium sp. R2-5 TaxID=2715751 RepID=UPI00141EC334|nr:hypothetical protein [Halobacterium sp. R2-5]
MEYEISADESVSVAVVRAVSAVRGMKPDTLPALGNVLDTDALDVMFGPQNDGTPRTGGRVSFVYGDCRVAVEHGEYLSLEPLDAAVGRERNPERSEDGHT